MAFYPQSTMTAPAAPFAAAPSMYPQAAYPQAAYPQAAYPQAYAPRVVSETVYQVSAPAPIPVYAPAPAAPATTTQPYRALFTVGALRNVPALSRRLPVRPKSATRPPEGFE
eukprot:NODE_6792_length_535_cov_47.028807_g6366_i0.p3 GENE.NODE_6792_length_535_cov_47.028807_g6366_i0~~NODE_6792_length_535_cov_47.028807_g6366_i0.p3  ORF type:complete len:112 (+),score=3.98 NODE_6792_length_535_cov_47.028807_g6366_i0:59-394(+)